MKKFLIILFCFGNIIAKSQYYLRGKIINEAGEPVSAATLTVPASGTQVRSGFDGSFGINMPHQSDSVIITSDHYRDTTVFCQASIKQLLTLCTVKNKATTAVKFSNLVDGYKYNRTFYSAAALTYNDPVDNIVAVAAEHPAVSCALNVNKASYSNARRYILSGQKVPSNIIRSEDFVNYFNPGYQAPAKAETFSVNTEITACPWNENDRLLLIKTCSRRLNLASVPPANFVFLVDVSASMELPDRLPLLKDGLNAFVNALRNEDRISLVVYGGTVATLLMAEAGNNKAYIHGVIDSLKTGGFTPGESAITTAYDLARNTFIKGGNNRVIIATDGDFNVGISNTNELEVLIANYRNTGISLTCIGVGMGNYKNARLEALARIGNGNFAYIDNLQESEKVLVSELTQNMYAVANDVKLTVRMNPDFVKKYVLIGYENKYQALKDSIRQLDGGEIGGGASNYTVIQFTPSDGKPVTGGEKLGQVSLDYRIPGEERLENVQAAIENGFKNFGELPAPSRFAVAATQLALMLKSPASANTAAWETLRRLSAESADGSVMQAGFADLCDRAENLYDPAGYRKRNKKK